MALILLALAFGLILLIVASGVKIIRQQRVGVVERLGKFKTTLEPGPHWVVPLVDRVTERMDMREQVVPFPPQGVITEDNLMVNIDSVIYFQIVDPVRANYEAQNYVAAIEQLTQTTLRNIIGGLDLEETLTSREQINGKLRVVLDEATGKWGIKVNRVELRSIEPPPTIRDAMEKGARAERDKRAAILLAQGQRQAQVESATGDRDSAILRAQGDQEAQLLRAQADRQAQMLRSEGEAQAITTVFNAIHAGQPDQALLAYQYMQMLPALARGDANKVWVIPSEITKALEGLGGAVSDVSSAIPQAVKGDFSPPKKIDVQAEIELQAQKARETRAQIVADAAAAAERGAERMASLAPIEQAPPAGPGPALEPSAQPYPAYRPAGGYADTQAQLAPQQPPPGGAPQPPANG